MFKVIIDGVEYTPKGRSEVDEQKAFKMLAEVYGVLWMEANYDPDNEITQKFAKPLADKMTGINMILGFKK